MITRRALLGAAGAMVAAGKKRNKRKWPVGWQQNIFPLLIVTAGPGFQGFFEYSPTVGHNKLVSSDTPIGGTDPYGNVYLPGKVVYYALGGGPFGATQISPSGGVVFWSAPDEAGPWTAGSQVSGFASPGFLPTLTLAANGVFGVNHALLGAGFGFATGQGLAIQTLINGSTINTAGLTMQPVTAAASVTGIILQPGTSDGQTIELPSDAGAGVTITFAAAATSHVKTGVGTVIQPGSTLVLKWVAATSLWYPVQ